MVVRLLGCVFLFSLSVTANSNLFQCAKNLNSYPFVSEMEEGEAKSLVIAVLKDWDRGIKASETLDVFLKEKKFDRYQTLKRFYQKLIQLGSTSSEDALFSNKYQLVFSEPHHHQSILNYLSKSLLDETDENEELLQEVLTRMAQEEPLLLVSLISDLFREFDESFFLAKEILTGETVVRPKPVVAPVKKRGWRHPVFTHGLSGLTGVILATTISLNWSHSVPEAQEEPVAETRVPLNVAVKPAPTPQAEKKAEPPKPSLRKFQPGLYRLQTQNVPDAVLAFSEVRAGVADVVDAKGQVKKKLILEGKENQSVEYLFQNAEASQSSVTEEPLEKEDRPPRPSKPGRVEILSESQFQITPRVEVLSNGSKIPVLVFEKY